MSNDLPTNTSCLPCVIIPADEAAVGLDSDRHQENEEMTGSASRADSKFEVGAVLLDAIHEFSSNDCTEGEGEGIGGEIYGDGEGEGEGEGDGFIEGEADGDGEILHCSFPSCQKEFTSRWSLTRHIRTHTGEKPFKCNVCGKEFVQKCTLKRHANTHTQEKQWICDFGSCMKRFKLKEYLDVHKRTHIKIDTIQKAPENEDQLVSDAANTAGALIDQLRQRLVRMSVRHHEQIIFLQKREANLFLSLQDCSNVLLETVNHINDRNAGYVPPYMVEASIRISQIVSKHASSAMACGVTTGVGVGIDTGLIVRANALLNPVTALSNTVNSLLNSELQHLNEMDDDSGHKYSVEDDEYRMNVENEYVSRRSSVRDSDRTDTPSYLYSILDRGQMSMINSNNNSNSNSCSSSSSSSSNSSKYPSGNDMMCLNTSTNTHTNTNTKTSTSSITKKTTDIPSSVGILNQHSENVARLSMKRVHDDGSNSQRLQLPHMNHNQDLNHSVDYTHNTHNIQTIQNKPQLCSFIPHSNQYGIRLTSSSTSSSSSSSSSSTSSSTSPPPPFEVLRAQGINSASMYPQYHAEINELNRLRLNTHTNTNTNTNTHTNTNININTNTSSNIDTRLRPSFSSEHIITENYPSLNSYLPPNSINSNSLYSIPKTGPSSAGSGLDNNYKDRNR